MSDRALLNPKAAEYLAKLCGMLGSAHDGERSNAARLADQFVRQLGLTWFDVIFVAPEWVQMAKFCREHARELSARETDFINTISRQRRHPSDKQLKWLVDVYERLREGA